MENEFCIKEDGSVVIPINADGLPSAVGLIPTINYKPEERLKILQDALDGLVLQGYWVEGWKWIKNPAFDKKGEKTTAEIKYRVCKTKDEALIIVETIKEIIGNIGLTKDRVLPQGCL
jgi:hypothetical protein